MREETLLAREEGLNKRNSELRQALYKFNKFLHENDVKRSRAEKKFHEESKLKAEKEEEIVTLQTELEELRKRREEQKSVLAKNKRYEQFLDLVEQVNESENRGTESGHLLKRHDTLVNAHQDLLAKIAETEQETEEMRIDMKKYISARQDEILKCNNQLAKLQKKMEHSEDSVIDMQASAERAIKTSMKEQHDLAQIRLACQNVFDRCLASSKIRSLKVRHSQTKSIEEQLRYIRQYLTDLMEIDAAWREMNAPPPEEDE